MMKRALALAAISLGLSICPANAAYIYVSGPVDGACAFAFHGDIKTGDQHIFETLVEGCTTGGVLFKSNGGELLVGLQIGEIIRRTGLETLVSFDGACASACALAWLGGTKRSMFETSLVGFHSAFTVEDGVATVSSVGNALVGAYMTQMGLPLDAVTYAVSAAPDDMAWLTSRDAADLGIDATILTADDMAWVQSLADTNPF